MADRKPGLSGAARKRQSVPSKPATKKMARMVRKSPKPAPVGGGKKNTLEQGPMRRATPPSQVNKRPLTKKAKPSTPAKNTGGLEKKSWGGWSPPTKVKPSKKTAAGVQRRSELASRKAAVAEYLRGSR